MHASATGSTTITDMTATVETFSNLRQANSPKFIKRRTMTRLL
jgi:hypothetical protein